MGYTRVTKNLPQKIEARLAEIERLLLEISYEGNDDAIALAAAQLFDEAAYTIWDAIKFDSPQNPEHLNHTREVLDAARSIISQSTTTRNAESSG